ncbi:MAG: OmpH family outer membrane protein [Bacteroides sp.]|jgi:outer membrane chaperone skp (ompH)
MTTKLWVLVGVLVVLPFLTFAQKYAFVDSEYILNKIPSYRAAKEEVEKLSTRYQQEIEQGMADIQKRVKDFQAEQVLLTPEKRQKRQQELVDAETKVKELQQKYFGREGLLFKKQDELIKPIQDQVFAAVKELANEGGYAAIFDVASSPSILYSSPRYDKSDEVLRKLGFN